MPAALLLQHGGRRQAYAGHHSTQVDVERGLITGRVGGEEIATLANACHQQCSIQAPIPDGWGGVGRGGVEWGWVGQVGGCGWLHRGGGLVGLYCACELNPTDKLKWAYAGLRMTAQKFEALLQETPWLCCRSCC